jgi:hypothetical protein
LSPANYTAGFPEIECGNLPAFGRQIAAVQLFADKFLE